MNEWTDEEAKLLYALCCCTMAMHAGLDSVANEAADSARHYRRLVSPEGLDKARGAFRRFVLSNGFCKLDEEIGIRNGYFMEDL